MSEISEPPRGNVGVLCTSLCSLHNVLLYLHICTHTHTHSCVCPYKCAIEDTAMKDERGDDVSDNESNEWEVGRELMRSSCAKMCSPFHRSLDIYLCTLYVGSASFPWQRARFVCRYWPSYFITRFRVQEKVCCFRFEYFHAQFPLFRPHECSSMHESFAMITSFTKCNKYDRIRRIRTVYTMMYQLKVTSRNKTVLFLPSFFVEIVLGYFHLFDNFLYIIHD